MNLALRTALPLPSFSQISFFQKRIWLFDFWQMQIFPHSLDIQGCICTGPLLLDSTTAEPAYPNCSCMFPPQTSGEDLATLSPHCQRNHWWSVDQDVLFDWRYQPGCLPQFSMLKPHWHWLLLGNSVAYHTMRHTRRAPMHWATANLCQHFQGHPFNDSKLRAQGDKEGCKTGQSPLRLSQPILFTATEQ